MTGGSWRRRIGQRSCRNDPTAFDRLSRLQRRVAEAAERKGEDDAVKSCEVRKCEAMDQGLWVLGGAAALLVVYMLIERRWLTSWCLRSWCLTSCGLGYVISVGVSIPVTAAWPNLLYRLLDRYVPRKAKDFEAGEGAGRQRIWWIAVLVGIFERTLFTTLVAYDISGSGSFIVTWVVIKMVSGWQKWSVGTQYARAAVFIALLGNAMSILLAVLGGILCQEPPC